MNSNQYVPRSYVQAKLDDGRIVQGYLQLDERMNWVLTDSKGRIYGRVKKILEVAPNLNMSAEYATS